MNSISSLKRVLADLEQKLDMARREDAKPTSDLALSATRGGVVIGLEMAISTVRSEIALESVGDQK